MQKSRDRTIALILLSPSLAFIALFVYYFIGYTIYVSLTDWGGASAYLAEARINFIGLKNYQQLFTSFLNFRFRQDLINTVFYLCFVTLGALGLGLLFAILLDREPRGEDVFKTLFLYPMALSFVVTGTIWRWLLTSHGINALPMVVGLPPLEFTWISSHVQVLQFQWQYFPTITGALIGGVLILLALQARSRSFSRVVALLVPAAIMLAWAGWMLTRAPQSPLVGEVHGFNLATVGVILVAVWQYSGYTMALYLAGLRGVSGDLHEAAQLDGCSELQYYLRVAIPLLKPLTVSAVIILAHISLKMFALIFALAGPDNAGTSHLSLLMYLKTFRGNQLGLGAAVSVVLFLMVALFVVPYLLRSSGQEVT